MPNSTPNDGSLQSTKQMLDELDALMEKMLALPVSDADEGPEVSKEVVSPQALTATLALLQAPPSTEPAAAAPVLEAAVHPVLNRPHLPLAPAPLTNDVVPPSVLPKLETLLASVPDEAPPARVVWLYWPLLWINQAFDGCAWLFGMRDSLRNPGARMVLGLTGIAFLTASIGWLVKDWLGWQW